MGKSADEKGFGHAGHAFDERMVAGEDGDERFVDDIDLANDHFGDFLPCLDENLFEAFSIGLHGGPARI